MPTGVGPPDPGLPQSVFNALNGMSYDSTNLAFSDSGTLNYMFVEQGESEDVARWFYGTASEGGNHPRAKIPQNTYDIIHGGTYNTSDSTVAYSGRNHRFALK